jgi:hypothetical protein
MKTTITLDGEEVDVIRTEVYNLVDALKYDQGVATEEDQERLDMLKQLLRKFEAAARRIQRKYQHRV